jgi:hypothetical protein
VNDQEPQGPMKEPAVERLVAENAQKALCLRLRSMTSATICSRLLSAKRPSLPPETLQRKAEGLASALRSALGFWESDSAALNAKILAQYYFALQLSIAAQVADGNPDSNLDEVLGWARCNHQTRVFRITIMWRLSNLVISLPIAIRLE